MVARKGKITRKWRWQLLYYQQHSLKRGELENQTEIIHDIHLLIPFPNGVLRKPVPSFGVGNGGQKWA